MYQGNHELINNINRYQVLFHAKRGIQELNYDAMKEIKILELKVCDQLRFVLPPDYVNWVRVNLMKNGMLFPMTENVQTNWSGAYLQDNDCRILFDIDEYKETEFSNKILWPVIIVILIDSKLSLSSRPRKSQARPRKNSATSA